MDPAPWRTASARASRPWRTAIARLSDRVSLEWIGAKSLEDAAGGELAVSHAGTLTAARVSAPDIEPFLAVSMYAPWRRPHKVTGSRRIFSDASAHRVISHSAGSVLLWRSGGSGSVRPLHRHSAAHRPTPPRSGRVGRPAVLAPPMAESAQSFRRSPALLNRMEGRSASCTAGHADRLL